MDIIINDQSLLSKKINVESWVIDFSEKKVGYDTMAYRNSRVRNDARYESKKATIKAKFMTTSQKAFDDRMNQIYAMFPKQNNDVKVEFVYDSIAQADSATVFKNVNEVGNRTIYRTYSNAFFDYMQSVSTTKMNRYLIADTPEIAVSYDEDIEDGTVYELTLTFTTSTIPFALSDIESMYDLSSDTINYVGNQPLSQLDFDFYVEAKLTSSISGGLQVTIGSNTCRVDGDFESGDSVYFYPDKVELLSGNTRTNITSRSNFNYFELDSTENVISNGTGTLYLHNAYNLFR